MAETRLDTPHELLNWFVVTAGVVCWATRDVAALRGFKGKQLLKLKPSNAGKPAGARTVHGRGYVVHCTGRRFLTVDIADAIAAGYEWPWDLSRHISHDPTSFVPAADEIVASTWELNDDGEVVWREDRHADVLAGSVASGALLSGPRGRFISTRGQAFLALDVIHYLHEGRWPWAGLDNVNLAVPAVVPQVERANSLAWTPGHDVAERLKLWNESKAKRDAEWD